MDLLQSLQPLKGATGLDGPADRASAPEMGLNEAESDTMRHSEGNVELPSPGTNQPISPVSPETGASCEFPAALSAGSSTEFDTQRSYPAIPRSAPCPCGSGRKYKRCCGTGPARPLGMAA
jgi:hypothetical protein